jgi:hypothetical protein
LALVLRPTINRREAFGEASSTSATQLGSEEESTPTGSLGVRMQKAEWLT